MVDELKDWQRAFTSEKTPEKEEAPLRFFFFFFFRLLFFLVHEHQINSLVFCCLTRDGSSPLDTKSI